MTDTNDISSALSNIPFGEPQREVIEVWLSRKGKFTIRHAEIHEDDRRVVMDDPDSLSMRGAQREVTAFYKADDWEPLGRWEPEKVSDEDGEVLEASRKFRRSVRA